MSSYSVAISWKPTWWKEYFILRIISDLNQKISSGKYECGMYLTNEKQLASQYSISVSTVRKVLSELEQWGLVETLNAKGTIVIEPDDSQVNKALPNPMRTQEAISSCITTASFYHPSYSLTSSSKIHFIQMGRIRAIACYIDWNIPPYWMGTLCRLLL